MKELGLLFTADMVRAILVGRKTRTMRPMRKQPNRNAVMGRMESDGFAFWGMTDKHGRALLYDHGIKSPCVPGDLIVGRETWGLIATADTAHTQRGRVLRGEYVLLAMDHAPMKVVYRADGEYRDEDGDMMWRPSVHLPFCDSRLRLPVVRVRVQRPIDVTEEEAESEGVGYEHTRCDGECGATPCGLAGGAFRKLWQSLYGPDSLETWCWVYEWEPMKGASK